MEPPYVGCYVGTALRGGGILSLVTLPDSVHRQVLKLVLQISKGLIRDTRARRTLMFYVVLVALVLLFTGATVLDLWLREHVLLFAAFWLICAWLTLLALLLALFDLLIVRAAARAERRRLEREYLRRKPPGEHDENAS